MADDDRGDVLRGAELDELRSQLRCADAWLRADAVGRLRAWQGRRLDDAAADMALRAATVSYPWVPAVPDDVAELLVQLLWAVPGQVGAHRIQHSYPLGAERARRAMLHLLALQRSGEAVEVVARLIDVDGPWDLLPAPTADLLTPMLGAPGVERLALPLVPVAGRRGWAHHAAALLTDLVDRGMLEPVTVSAVAAGLAPLVDGLLDACNRAVAAREGRRDVSQVDRRRLGALLPLLARLPGEVCGPVLARALASADPRVSAVAAVHLARRGAPVAEERIALIARDPEARALLADGLGSGAHPSAPPMLRDQRAMAEAEMVRWLASETQLGIAPDEVEHRGSVVCPSEWGRGVLQLFAFRVRPPHWSASRGWMVGAVGPWGAHPADRLHHREGFAAFSLYRCEDDLPLSGHVVAIAEALSVDRPGEVA